MESERTLAAETGQLGGPESGEAQVRDSGQAPAERPSAPTIGNIQSKSLRPNHRSSDNDDLVAQQTIPQRTAPASMQGYP